MIRHLATLALLITSAAPLAAQTFDTRATAAYVLDHTTGIVLLEKNADDPLPPASMSKLMTLYMAFEAINPLNGQDPIVTVDDVLPVSQHLPKVCRAAGPKRGSPNKWRCVRVNLA